MYSYSQFSQLAGKNLILTQLKESDVAEAAARLYSPTTWPVVMRGIKTIDQTKTYLSNFVNADSRGESLTLLARIKDSGEIAALSRFHSAPANFTRVEIGFTWIADKWMRTFVNTEKKFLMMSYAFETVGVKRVEFSVDPRNDKSNAAMKRIGGQFEGTLRKWRFLSAEDPGNRNIYSVIEDEWPATKQRLLQLMAR